MSDRYVPAVLLAGLGLALVGPTLLANGDPPHNPRQDRTPATVTATPAVTVTTTTTAAPTVTATHTVTATATRTVTRAARSSSRGPTPAQWARLRDCESGDRPTAVSSSGKYHGLYQFDIPTWRSVGGTGLPSNATRAEQDRRAQQLYDARGAQPWPVCGRWLR